MSRICPVLASPGQAMAQVSDTWGPESHARKPNTLGPQPPISSSYEQTGLLEEEAGLQLGDRLLPGRGHKEGSPTNRGERLRGGGRGWGRKSRVERTKLGQAEGLVLQEKGEMGIESRPLSSSLAECPEVRPLVCLPCLLHTSASLAL